MSEGAEYIKRVVQLFDSLYMQTTRGELDSTEAAKEGFKAAFGWLAAMDSNFVDNFSDMFRLDPEGTVRQIAQIFVDSKILVIEVLGSPDSNGVAKVVYKPHPQFNEVLKNGIW